MSWVKKIDIYLLRNFLGLFVATFFIAIFILLMQFMWIHVDDLVGKGIGIGVLSEFFVYATAAIVPLALPLAILLSSIISFGNPAEFNHLVRQLGGEVGADGDEGRGYLALPHHASACDSGGAAERRCVFF